MVTYKQIGGKNPVTNRCLDVLMSSQKPRYRTLKIFRGVDYRTAGNDGESPQDRYKYSWQYKRTTGHAGVSRRIV